MGYNMLQCLIKVIWLRSDQVSDVPKVMYRKLENLVFDIISFYLEIKRKKLNFL